MIDTKKLAYELYESDDIQFAEVVAYLNCMRKGALTHGDGSISENLEKLTLTKDEVLAVTAEAESCSIFNWLRVILSEIIDNPEVNVSAWWKQKA